MRNKARIDLFAFRHIGFAWALHAGWNIVGLPSAIYDASTNELLHEPQIFDRVLGAPIVVAMACAVAALSFLFLVRDSLISPENPRRVRNGRPNEWERMRSQ